jgi:hypothetical protein
MQKNCTDCGCKMVWAHPDMPGLWLKSSMGDFENE